MFGLSDLWLRLSSAMENFKIQIFEKGEICDTTSNLKPSCVDLVLITARILLPSITSIVGLLHVFLYQDDPTLRSLPTISSCQPQCSRYERCGERPCTTMFMVRWALSIWSSSIPMGSPACSLSLSQICRQGAWPSSANFAGRLCFPSAGYLYKVRWGDVPRSTSPPTCSSKGESTLGHVGETRGQVSTGADASDRSRQGEAGLQTFEQTGSESSITK